MSDPVLPTQDVIDAVRDEYLLAVKNQASAEAESLNARVRTKNLARQLGALMTAHTGISVGDIVTRLVTVGYGRPFRTQTWRYKVQGVSVEPPFNNMPLHVVFRLQRINRQNESMNHAVAYWPVNQVTKEVKRQAED